MLLYIESMDYRELYEARLDRVSFLEEELRQAHLRLFNVENLSVSYQARITALQNENESYLRFMEAEKEAMKQKLEQERVRFEDKLERLQMEFQEAQASAEDKQLSEAEVLEESDEAASVTEEETQKVYDYEYTTDEHMMEEETSSVETGVEPPPISLTTPATFPDALISKRFEEEPPRDENAVFIDVAVIASVVAFITMW